MLLDKPSSSSSSSAPTGRSQDVRTSFSVSLIALALAKSGHPSAEAAFEILSQFQRESRDGIFWGDDDRHGCSLSMRTTAVALAVFAHRGEVMGRQIAKWIQLNLMKWKHMSRVGVREKRAYHCNSQNKLLCPVWCFDIF